MNATAATAPTDLAEFVHEQMARWSVPGVAIGVLHDGVTETWGFGVASIETGQPAMAGTLFQIGSISKVFTATLVMQLVDQGKLDLDRPVVRYLPSLRLADPAAQQTVTLRHLLTHTPGFYGDRFEDYGPGDDALSKAIAEFHTLRQWTPPGTTWAYCNTGFQLAGAVIEAVLQTSFEAAARERLLVPLGLDRSFYFAHEAITYPLAVGHNKLPGRDLEVARLWARPRCRSPQGGLISNVADLLTFAAFHLGGGKAEGKHILSDASRRAMQQPEVEAGSFADSYGVGWALRRGEPGAMVVGHGGSTNGYRAALALVPEQRVAVAVLTNGSEGVHVHRAVEDWALAHYAGVRRRAPTFITLPPEALARLEGRYVRPANEVAVRARDGGLEIQVVSEDPFTRARTTWPPMHARSLDAHRFYGLEGDAAGETIDFIPYADPGMPGRFIRLHGRLGELTKDD